MESPWIINQAYLIRTVTHYWTGRVTAVGEHEIQITDAAWVADVGSYYDALKYGVLGDVEPAPDGNVIVGRGAIVDAAPWNHPLPRDLMKQGFNMDITLIRHLTRKV